MADVTQLLKKILSDPKIAENSNLASKLYSDEPILMTAPQMARFTPPRIREMRKLAKGAGFDAKTFYEQGRFMESFEDDFDYRGEFVQYFPTYQHMTDVQLRGYFSWRAKVRRGVVEATSLSFAFVHIYELLNQIGVATPVDGFHALKNFWQAYREHDRRINSYVELWLKDYVVYNNLDVTLLEGMADLTFDGAAAVLLDHRAYGAGEVFAALNSVSSYDMEGSRFFKQHPDEVMNVVCRVFSVISDYHNRNDKQSASDKFFGRLCASPYVMFKAAVFHERVAQPDRVYEIGKAHKYVCRDGRWVCERYLSYGRNNRQIGGLLKTVDFIMRREYGFGSTLQTGKINKILKGKIEKEIAKFLAEKKEAESRRVDIDLSKLQGIRTAASATRDKLLVEEEETACAPEKPAAEESPPERETGLTGDETLFVKCLLNGQSYSELVRSRGLMTSVLVDGINEKLFDAFGDTVIADEGDGPVLIEDYIEELKGLIK